LYPILAPHAKLMSDDDLKADLHKNAKKSSGVFGRMGRYPTKGEFLAKLERTNMSIRDYLFMHIMANPILPFLWYAKMKKEWVTLMKLLSRKQRMYIIMCVEHLCGHKIFYGKMQKALRLKLEVKHGQTWFYGFVDLMSKDMEGSKVHSMDYDKWDKRYQFSNSVYKLLDRVQDKVINLDHKDRYLRNLVRENCVNTVVIMPEGDVVRIANRQNPSGKDGTTEHNCLAHMLIETYMQILYFKSIDKPIDKSIINRKHRGTGYLGDDRIAASGGFEPGYLEFYNSNISKVGLVLKELKVTEGPENACFAGFEVKRSHWDESFYVPYYKIDKIFAGLFTNTTHDPTVVMSRFMAFAILMFPQIHEYRRLKPHVLTFIESFVDHKSYSATVVFWTDEQYMIRLWSGKESVPEVEGGITKRLNVFTRFTNW